MPTPSEKKALLFLGAVALMGGAVRLFGSGPAAAEATVAEQDRLAAQIVAAEGAAAAARAERSGKSGGSPKGKRKRPVTGGEAGPGGRATANAAGDRPGVARRPLAGPVDVDRATIEELDALPGVGPSLAARIVADRNANGPFGSLAALDAVSGVGPALISKVAPHVTFSGPRRPTNANGSGGGVRVSGRVVGLIGGRP